MGLILYNYIRMLSLHLIILSLVTLAFGKTDNRYYPCVSNDIEFSPEVKSYWEKEDSGKKIELQKRSNNTVFEYDNEKVYGVNLGGWLVTEPYITPSLYENALSDGETDDDIPVDEYHYCKKLGTKECESRLQDHWATFINETDFKQIKNWGFNTVRLPIGYWAFAHRKQDPFCFGQEEYLQKTIEWCRKYGLHVWVDLHGMPGSQNGFDNSGLRGDANWLNVTSNFELGNEVLYYIQDRYGKEEFNDVISGIENVNEPIGPKISMRKLKKFDKNSYSQQRATGSDNYFIYHDAFMSTGYWDDIFENGASITGHTNFTYNNYTSSPSFKNLTDNQQSTYYNGTIYNSVLDHHRYEVFSVGSLSLNLTGHISSLESFTSGVMNESAPVKIIGEWAAALTDCAKWLNGVGTESRYEGKFSSDTVIGKCTYSNDYSKMSTQNKTDTRKLVEAQLDLFNKTNGFIFWCYKTENAIEFDLSKLIEHDLFPQPLSERKYPNVLKSSASVITIRMNKLLTLEVALGVLVVLLTM